MQKDRNGIPLLGMVILLCVFTTFLSAQAPDTLWTKTYGGGADEEGWSIEQTDDGGYIMAGVTLSFGDGEQAYIVKTDADGDTLWNKIYSGAGRDYGVSIQQTFDTCYIIAGMYQLANSDVWFLKTDTDGDTLWTAKYGGAFWDRGLSVQQTSDSGYIVLGTSESFGNGRQFYTVKTAPDVGIEELVSKSIQSGFSGATIFSGPLLLPEGRECRLFDITGRVVAPEKVRPGIYFLEVDGKVTQKIIKLR